jgi:hypothetical protein
MLIMSNRHENYNVCILGCGRSGTSIFGELFEHLNDYTYYSEPLFRDLKNFDYSKPIAIKVPKSEENQICLPGLSFDLNEFLRIFETPRVLFWQVRHPLDAICSLRIGISNNWGHHPRPIDWNEWLDKPLLKQCAYHWNYINTVGFTHVKELVTILKFEDTINNPLKTAHTVAKTACIDIKKNENEISEWAKRVQNTNNRDFIEAKCSRNYSRPYHEKRVERWKENLSIEEVNSILPLIKEGAANFGYDLSKVI